MAVIRWRDTYDTGVEAVDIEHRKLVELVEAMHISIRDNEPKDTVDRVINEIVEYTQDHFKNEESLMQNELYPELDEHKQEHQKLIEEVGIFKERLMNNFPDGRQDFYRFLREWLINHILGSDKKFGAYVSSK